jgi:hypothetical protein
VTVDVLNVTDPEGDPFEITIESIYQDELVNGTDDGNTVPDGMGIGTTYAEVRAERDGEGNGRVYHIVFTAHNTAGACTGEVLVSVPIEKKDVAVDDGPLYDSTEE